MAYTAKCNTASATKWWITGTGSSVNRLSEVMDDNASGVEEDDNSGNFQPWSTFMTEHIEDADYQIHLNFDIGDDSTPTTLESKDGEHVHGDDGALFAVKANATLQFGSVVSSYSGLGASWNFQIIDSYTDPTFCVSGSVLKVYGSFMVFRGLTKDATIWETEIKQSIFANLTGGNIAFRSASTDISGQVYFSKCGPRFYATPANAEDIHINGASFGVFATYTGSTITLKGVNITNSVSGEVLAGGTSGSNVNIVNPINNISSVTIGTVEDAQIKEQYTFNLHVRDKDGVNLQSVTCLLEDTNSNQIFSVSTAADGTITEQTVDYKKWESTDETLTEYTPHKLTLSKTNYNTQTHPITMDELKDLEYKLLPALAESDVADGVNFGEDKTGTFARTTVTGATVKGQSTVGIVVGE